MRALTSQISIHKLEVFCAVAEMNSVSAAAERLGIAQPVVSVHLKGLAGKLGAPLVQRRGRNIALTETGERVYLWAKEVVSRTKELERDLAENHSGIAGKARIGGSMTIGSYVLPALIAAFQTDNPNGKVSVFVANPKSILDALHAGNCDFAFTILDPRFETEGLSAEVVAEEPLVLVCGSNTLIRGNSLLPADLETTPFVSAQLGTSRREIEEYLLRKNGMRRNAARMEFGHAESIKQAVRAGVGVAFLFRSSIKDELAHGILREISLEGTDLRAPVYCVRRKSKKLSTFQIAMLQDLSARLHEACGDGRVPEQAQALPFSADAMAGE